MRSLFGNRKQQRSNKGKQSDNNRGRSSWARRSPCYICARFGHTARDHGMSYPYSDEIERWYKLTQKHWLIILKLSESIDGDRVEWEDVAKEIHVDVAGWPKMPHKRGLARVLHAKVGLEPWTTIDDVGTDCSPSQCFTPDDLKREEESSQDSTSIKNTLSDLGFTTEWKSSIDSKLVTLENNVGGLQKSQNASLGMMQMMLEAQGIPKHLIEARMRDAGFSCEPQGHAQPLSKKPPETPIRPQSSSNRTNPSPPREPVVDVDMNSDADLFDEPPEPIWSDDTSSALAIPISSMKQGALARCSNEKVTSFVLKTRSKCELVALLSHVCESGVFSILPDDQAKHWKFHVIHAAAGFSIVEARVVCKAKTDGHVVVNTMDPRGEVVPMKAYKASQGVEVPLSNIYGCAEGARLTLARAAESSQHRLSAEGLFKI